MTGFIAIEGLLAGWRIPTLAVVLLGAAAGCGQPSAAFKGNAVFAKRMELETGSDLATAQADVAEALQSIFGTPDQPLWPNERTLERLLNSGEEPVIVDQGEVDRSGDLVDVDRLVHAAGAVSSAEDGTNFGLYRKHCITCHGVSGDGVGPAAKLLNPYPRDFRLGKFKFKSTPIGTKPSRDDLRRTLEHGIPGTSMPSFKLLSEDDLEALTDYIIYLSVRGEVERAWLREAAMEVDYTSGERLFDGSLAASDPESLQVQWSSLLPWVERTINAWGKGQEQQIAPELPAELAVFEPGMSLPPSGPLADSIARGKALFLGDVASCAKCHGVLGLGEGINQDYDDWTKDWTVMAGLQPNNKEQLRPMLKLGALSPRTISPRNLRTGILRGGSRPADVYWRIVNGIEGTPMPAAPMQPDNTLGLSQTDVWDLVNYVLSLPYEQISSGEMAGEGSDERTGGDARLAANPTGVKL